MDLNPLPPAYESTVLNPVLLVMCYLVVVGNRVSEIDFFNIALLAIFVLLVKYLEL